MSIHSSTLHAKRLLLIAAASASLLAFAPNSRATAGAGQPGSNQPENAPPNPVIVMPDAANQAGQIPQRPRLPDGFIEKDMGAGTGVKAALVGLTQRALARDSFSSLYYGDLAQAAKRDKANAQELAGTSQAQLNTIIAQIQSGWRSKYGPELDVTAKNLLFNEKFPIVQGVVSEPGTAATNWPVAALPGQAAQAAESAQTQPSATDELAKGRAIAIICIPAGEGIPAMKVSLVRQAQDNQNNWYVDLPADRTGEQIYNDLSSHLSYLASHQDLWPADTADGYRMLTRHVAAALYGVPVPSETASAQ